MKKNLLVFLLLLLSICFVGCKKDDDKKLIRIQFVPSQEASVISAQAPVIEKLLAEQMKGYEFKISTGTDYTAVVNAMEAGQIEVGFLTAQQYAQASVENPGTVKPILTSIRAAYQVQIDYPNNFDQQIKAMNGEIEGYAYTGQQAEESVTYYNSICIAKKESAINSVKDLEGKKVAVQKTSSGAGYVYPAVKLNSEGLKFVTSLSGAKGEVLAIQQPNYPAAVNAVLNGDVDAAWIFLDVRYSNFYNNKDSEYYQKAEIFEMTKVVGMTTGIYNDTISVVTTLSDEVVEALQNAFMALAADGGEGAEALYKIYSHTGYKKATDADYAGEREVYNFKKNNLN